MDEVGYTNNISTIYKELDDNSYILQCIYKIRQQHSNVAKCFTQSSALLFAICCYLHNDIEIVFDVWLLLTDPSQRSSPASL